MTFHELSVVWISGTRVSHIRTACLNYRNHPSLIIALSTLRGWNWRFQLLHGAESFGSYKSEGSWKPTVHPRLAMDPPLELIQSTPPNPIPHLGLSSRKWHVPFRLIKILDAFFHSFMYVSLPCTLHPLSFHLLHQRVVKGKHDGKIISNIKKSTNPEGVAWNLGKSGSKEYYSNMRLLLQATTRSDTCYTVAGRLIV